MALKHRDSIKGKVDRDMGLTFDNENRIIDHQGKGFLCPDAKESAPEASVREKQAVEEGERKERR